MARLKYSVLAGMATAGVCLLPSAPAVAGGPLLFAPWALSHIVAPLIIGAAMSFQPQAPYAAAPGYGGPAGYYAPPSYVQQQPGYYTPPPAYYARGYYGPSSYRPATPRGYPFQRGGYPQRLPYHSSYGGHEVYRSGGFGRHGR